jgi:PAS domain S-box-containing protein
MDGNRIEARPRHARIATWTTPGDRAPMLVNKLVRRLTSHDSELASLATRYVFLVAVLSGATFLRVWLGKNVGPMPPYITFYPAVLLISIVAGGRVGVVATLASAVIADYLFVLPIGSFSIASEPEIVAFAIFVGTNLGLCAVSERVRRERWDDALKQQNALLAVTLASIGDGVVGVDERGYITFINAEAAKLIGWERSEAEGSKLGAVLQVSKAEGAQSPAEMVETVLRDGSIQRASDETLLKARSGREFPIELTAAPVRRDDGVIRGVVLTFNDVTERKRIEHELIQINVNFANASDAANLGFWQLDLATNKLSWDERMFQLYGRSSAEGESPYSIWASSIHPDDREASEHAVADAVTGQRDFASEFRIIPPDGQIRYLRASARVVCDARGRPQQMFGLNFDVTERRRDEEQLRLLNTRLEEQIAVRTAQVKERETLLQEIHHRVKNNLQVISSLMNMQVRSLADATARAALEECESRIQTMALIHEKLYQSRDYSQIPFSEYVRSLATSVFASSGISQNHITLSLELDEVFLPVDKAIPCGLILNELINNALKHAFQTSASGKIRVELRKSSEGQVSLSVTDDGSGILPDVKTKRASSMGLQLVESLVEQLDGRLEIRSRPGTAVCVTFSMESVI